MQEENITRAIIVVQMGMTPSAKQVSTRLIGGELNFYVSFGSIFLLFPMKVARGHFWGSRGKFHPPPPSVTPLGGGHSPFGDHSHQIGLYSLKLMKL